MFLEIGDPDKLLPNPHYQSAAPMRLYLRERLESWISRNLNWVEKIRNRRNQVKVAQIQQQTYQKIMDQFKLWEPIIRLNIPDNLVQVAQSYYLLRYHDFEYLTASNLIGYIRHYFTDFEQSLIFYLQAVEPNFGHYLYFILRDKVDQLIIDRFSWLLQKLP